MTDENIKKNVHVEKNSLERLKEKQAVLNARIQLLENREKEKQRKQETRLRILLGAFLLDELKKKNFEERNLTKEKLVIYFTKERDQNLINDYFEKMGNMAS